MLLVLEVLSAKEKGVIQGRPPGGHIVVSETSSSKIQQSEHNPRSAH